MKVINVSCRYKCVQFHSFSFFCLARPASVSFIALSILKLIIFVGRIIFEKDRCRIYITSDTATSKDKGVDILSPIHPIYVAKLLLQIRSMADLLVFLSILILHVALVST